jgi:hypothetical protein
MDDDIHGNIGYNIKAWLAIKISNIKGLNKLFRLLVVYFLIYKKEE